MSISVWKAENSTVGQANVSERGVHDHHADPQFTPKVSAAIKVNVQVHSRQGLGKIRSGSISFCYDRINRSR